MRSIDMPAMPTRIFESSDVTQTTNSYGIRSHIICVTRSSAPAMKWSSQGSGKSVAHMSMPRTDRQTKMAIATTIVLILIVLILATYGWLSGAWD